MAFIFMGCFQLNKYMKERKAKKQHMEQTSQDPYGTESKSQRPAQTSPSVAGDAGYRVTQDTAQRQNLSREASTPQNGGIMPAQYDAPTSGYTKD